MRVLLILPAGENVRVTTARPRVPRRAMLRFSVLPLTTVAALTPAEHDVTVFERTRRFLETTGVDTVQVNIRAPLPGTPLFAEFDRAGRIRDHDWAQDDFRHGVIEPARMTATDLQAGADWLRAQFYRLDRILWRFARGVFVVGWLPALLGLRLNLTYRRDNLREEIVGRSPAVTAVVEMAGPGSVQEAACVDG